MLGLTNVPQPSLPAQPSEAFSAERLRDGSGERPPVLNYSQSAAPAVPAGRQHGLLRNMPQLDGLRAVAVFLVFIQHFWVGPWKNCFPFGRFGVLLFFVLSGFLITAILLRCRSMADDGLQGRGFLLKRFYIRRFARLFPPYYLLLFAAAAVNVRSVATDDPTIRQTLGWHLTYLTNFFVAGFGEWHQPANHFWSLAVEEQFYLVWPWVVMLAPRKWLTPIVGSMIVLGPAYRTFATLAGWTENAALMPTPACIDTLGWGAMLAICSETPHLFQTWRRRLTRFCLIAGLPAVVFVAWAQWVPWWRHEAFGATFLTSLLGNDLNWWRPAMHVVADSMIGLLSFWIVATAATGFPGFVGWALQCRPMVYLGKISYGLYLYHLFTPFLVLPILKRLHMEPRPAENPTIYLVVMSVATVGIAAMSWHLLEAPISRLKEKAAGYRNGNKLAST